MLATTELAARLADAEARYAKSNPESRRLHEARARVMPGGNTRTTIHQPPFPLTIVRGEDARITDADDHEYLDFLGEYTAGLYGHSHPVIVEAILSFVNLSISTDDPTWGGIIAEGRLSIHQAWWVLVFPLLTLFLTVLSFSQFGEGLKARFDPVLR